MKKDEVSPRTPGWFKVVLLIVALPVLAWPWLMAMAKDSLGNRDENTMSWAFVMLSPLYVLASTWISCRIYPSWPTLAWVLQGLQVLVYAALVMLVQGGSRVV